MSKKQTATIERKVTEGSAKTFAHRPLNPDGQVAKISIDEIKEHISDVAICFKNYTYPGAEQAFPHQPVHHTVERYYPIGIHGPVYVDEPFYDDDLAICKKKAEVLRKAGHKYLILSKDCDLQSAMEQIGAI